jgi:transposase
LIGAALQEGLRAQLEAHPDARLEDHCRLWEEEQGMQVSTASISRAIARLGWTRKKRRWMPLNAAKTSERSGGSR